MGGRLGFIAAARIPTFCMILLMMLAVSHEEVHERASREQQPGQGAEYVRLVLGKEKKSSDGEEAE